MTWKLFHQHFWIWILSAVFQRWCSGLAHTTNKFLRSLWDVSPYPTACTGGLTFPSILPTGELGKVTKEEHGEVAARWGAAWAWRPCTSWAVRKAWSSSHVVAEPFRNRWQFPPSRSPPFLFVYYGCTTHNKGDRGSGWGKLTQMI